MPDRPAVPRRAALALGLSAPVLSARAQSAGAAWPAQPVRYINGFPAGGATDTLSRLYCARMSEITGQQFVVENRSGSGGLVGADAIAKSRPDGTTVGLGGIASHAIAPTLYASLPFDHRRDFTLVSGLWRLPNMLVVNNDLPARTVPELIELARSRPGGRQGSYASAGAGKLRPLAVTGKYRNAAAPDVRALAEHLPGFEVVSWTCLAAPAGLPPGMAGRMSALTRQALAGEELRRSFADHGAMPWWTTAEDLEAYRAAQEAALRPLILATGARVE